MSLTFLSFVVNVSETTIGWIVMKCCAHSHGAQRMNPNGDPDFSPSNISRSTGCITTTFCRHSWCPEDAIFVSL